MEFDAQATVVSPRVWALLWRPTEPRVSQTQGCTSSAARLPNRRLTTTKEVVHAVLYHIPTA